MAAFLEAPECTVRHVKSVTRRALAACAFASLFASVATAADIYTWTDERGTTVISDIRPDNPKALSNFKTVVEDSDRNTRRSGSAPREPTRTEQILLDRVENLERQLKAQAYTSPPPPTYSSGTYYTSLPPPPPAYDPFYSPYFGSWYPPVVVVAPFVRRSFAVHRPFHHRGFVHRGRR